MPVFQSVFPTVRGPGGALEWGSGAARVMSHDVIMIRPEVHDFTLG